LIDRNNILALYRGGCTFTTHVRSSNTIYSDIYNSPEVGEFEAADGVSFMDSACGEDGGTVLFKGGEEEEDVVPIAMLSSTTETAAAT
jgi:hypothetical protein